MPIVGPIKRKDLIYNLRRLGFEGPFSGKRHEFMRRGRIKVYIPNPHEGEISRGLLVKLLREAEIDRKEWEDL